MFIIGIIFKNILRLDCLFTKDKNVTYLPCWADMYDDFEDPLLSGSLNKFSLNQRRD